MMYYLCLIQLIIQQLSGKMQEQRESENITKPELIYQYYRTMELFYLTNYLQIQPRYYENLNFKKYQNLAIIGDFIKIQKLILKDKEEIEQKFYCPKIKLTVNGQQRLIIIQLDDYKRYFAKAFSDLLRTKENTKLMFTNLTVKVLEKKIQFVVNGQTQILELQPQYYNQFFKTIQDGVCKNVYSFENFEEFLLGSMKLNGPYEGYHAQTFLTKYGSKKKETVSLSGIVEFKPQKQNIKFNKQLMIFVHQPNIIKNSKQLGIALVVIKYFSEKEHILFEKLREGGNYLFQNTIKKLSEKMEIIYEVDDFNQITELEELPPIYNIRSLHNKLGITNFTELNSWKVYRNLMKFKVDISGVELIMIKYKCKKCKIQMKGKLCQYCSQSGELDVWTFLMAQDSTCEAFLSLNTSLFKKLFEIDHEMEEALIQICQQRGVLKLHEYSNCPYESLKVLKQNIKYKLFQKIIVGIPYVQHHKTFKQKLSQQDHINYERGFYNKVEFLNSIKINLNGAIVRFRNVKKPFKLLPSIRVQAIYDVMELDDDVIC